MVPSLVIFVCSSLIWQTVLDRYPRIVSVRSGCSVIYGFGSCSHRGGVMTGRSAPGYHLYRFPIAPSSLVCLTSPLSIPRDAPRRQSLPSQAIFDWFRILNWWATDEGDSLAVILGPSVCIPIGERRYFENDLVEVSPGIISENPFVARVSKSVSSKCVN